MKKLFLVFLMLIIITVSGSAETWSCPNCGNKKATDAFCSKCGTAKPAGSIPSTTESPLTGNTTEDISKKGVYYIRLYKGDSGESVLKAEEKLFELGYLTKKPLKDKYTDTVEKAVKNFELDFDLDVDGYLSSHDQEVLYDATAINKTLKTPTGFKGKAQKQNLTNGSKHYGQISDGLSGYNRRERYPRL